MMPFLSQETQNELARLAERYSQPLVRTVDLGQTSQFDPINKHDRYGEVCMVLRRRNGHLLTMKKTFYPIGAYRLLTGGIDHEEAIFDALLRETNEETGLEVVVRRFLVAAAYLIADAGEKPVFYTFAFLLDEIGGTLGAIDEDERVEAFLEIEPEQLPQRAAFLERIGGPRFSKEIAGSWSDWGKFRAAIHHLVWEALNVTQE
ncbi:MAG: NUDIX hydrolase [Ktedonobacteraceae bacterium]|nr:NUDIX hydrolase [Ktedonobacteraceae bacterium]